MERDRTSSNEDQQPETMAGRRRGRNAINPRAEALERLKALRRGDRRSESSYQVKYEEPIYDIVDEDKYNALVAERRDEFGDFIVDDDDDGTGRNLGYLDIGEEVDWTRSDLLDWSDESDGDGKGIGARRKKKQQPEKEAKEKRDPATGKKPPAALSAAAAMMGKQRISSMFTSSVFVKKGDDNKGALALDSIVDDVIAECMPNETDREKRRKEKMTSLGLGFSNASVRIQNSASLLSSLLREKREDIDGPLMNLRQSCQKTETPVEDKIENDESLGLDGQNARSAQFEQFYTNSEKLDGQSEMEGMEPEVVAKHDESKLMEEAKVDKPKAKEEVRAAQTEPGEEDDKKMRIKEDKNFSLNAIIKEPKVQVFSAAAELHSNGRLLMSASEGNTGHDTDEKSEFVLESDGCLPFYIIDAYEETFGVNMGTIYLFGKVKTGNTYQSCCVVVKNMQRCVYAVPSRNVFHHEELLKIEKEAAESKIYPGALRTKLHDVASGLKNEISKHLVGLNVSTFSMAPVKRSYAFERTDIPTGEYYVLKINYPFKDPPLSSDLKGENFCAVLGTNSSSLELFLVKRKIKGPSWLSVSKFSICPSHQRVSWCKFEVVVESPKDIQVLISTKIMAEIPPVIVTAINLKTIINEKQNVNEIISASLIHCKKAKIDTPMLASEWNKSDLLGSFTVVRKLEGGIYPLGFTKEVSDRNSKLQSVKLAYESSERALLNHLLIELYKLDSDVLVGHNISGFDLDVLLHRAQACKVPSNMWSKIGRLKRSVMPKLSKGSSVFGSGASPGIMTCIAGRLLCDTFLCSRDLLKEVSYSLTHLSKTQLNKDRKEIAPHDIPKLLQTTESLMELLDCNNTDAWLSMELMFHLSILPLTRHLTNISGNLWGKTLQGARAQRVEYLLLHSFHAKKYIIPDKYSARGKDTKPAKRKADEGNDADVDNTSFENESSLDDQGKGKKGSSYAGGLVLEPKKGLYDKIVLLLDFNSLYPSIIQEYNICFTTVERSIDGLAPSLPSCKKTGVLPELLKYLVERRRTVKSLLKKASGLKAQRLDIQQQALKLTANSMYGCLGFSNSRFYAKPLAELITSQGREILQSTVNLVQNNLNLEVIYGDTDSIMIYSGLDDFAQATDIARKVIREVNKKYKCLEIDLDGLYKRMLLLKKKKYAAVKIQIKDGTSYEVIERKGLDMVRRDWSLLSKEIGDFCLSQILSGGSCEDVLESIHNSLMKIQEEMRNGEVELEKYIITKTLTKPPEAYPDGKNQPHVQVALRLKQSGYSTGCSAGDTVPYIICCEEGGSSGTSVGIAQRARHPDELREDNVKWMIDIDYYLSQQIHPVVSRLCASIQGTSPARLADCLGLDPSKFQSKTTADVRNDSYSLLLSSADDEERYQGCESLTLSCPSCSGSFECPSVFCSLCKSVSVKPTEESVSLEVPNHNFWQKLCCPKCPEEGEIGVISPMMIANQVKRQAGHFISMYYKGTMACDDETCKYTTRSINLRVVGDSERGAMCPNYPRCNGHLVRKYSEADLYRQLSYFCHLLDTVHCVEKVDVKARMALEKELARVRPLVKLAAATAQEMRDRCAYGWVQFNDLFVV